MNKPWPFSPQWRAQHFRIEKHRIVRVQSQDTRECEARSSSLLIDRTALMASSSACLLACKSVKWAASETSARARHFGSPIDRATSTASRMTGSERKFPSCVKDVAIFSSSPISRTASNAPRSTSALSWRSAMRGASEAIAWARLSGSVIARASPSVSRRAESDKRDTSFAKIPAWLGG